MNGLLCLMKERGGFHELALRPREVDDEADDEEVEAADDKQQALFDAEAIATAAPKKKGWW